MGRNRRFLAVVLVWLVVVPVVVLGPGRDASAVDEPAVADVVFGERLSGAGSAAGRAGRVGLLVAFGDSPAICNDPLWVNVGVCAAGSDPVPTQAPTPTPTPEPTATPAPDYGQLKADAYSEAFDDLGDDLPEPQMRLWPAIDTFQIVNLDTYLYVEAGWDSISGQGQACDSWTPSECVTVSFAGEPEQSLWRFVEANSVNPPVEFACERGERQPDDPDTTPICGKTWTNSSDVTGDVTAEMTIRYAVTVTTTHAGHRPELNIAFKLDSPEPDEETLTVAEVQTYGHSDAAPVAEESNGGLCSKWGISFICWVGDKAKDAAIWALVNAVPGLEQVWEFFKGCGDGVLDELGGVLEILNTIKDAITDPGAFISEKLQAMKDLYEAATTDTEGFIREVLAGVLDLEYLETHTTAEWVGKTACSMAIQYLSGAAAAKFTQKLDDFLGRRGKGRNADSCRVSSFPGTTQVLMANNTYTRIDQIRPGDQVMSHNLDTSVWEPRLVVDQWSHLDRGPPATVTLNDQTTITATNDHLFWQPATSRWIELQHVTTDDVLLTPNGPIEVDHITLGEARDWTVWELTVADNHNFTVSSGTTDILVHNGGRCSHTNDDGSIVHSNADGTYDYTAPDGTEYTNVSIGDDGLPLLDADGRPIYTGRSVEQLLPNGSIPTPKGTPSYADWWDDLTPAELDRLMDDPDYAKAIKANIREGGVHEWCMCSRVQRFKEWGVSMDQIQDFVTDTVNVRGDRTPLRAPDGTRYDTDWAGQDWRHPSVEAPNSKPSAAFHNELGSLIDNAPDLQSFKDQLPALLDRWGMDPSALPEFPDVATP